MTQQEILQNFFDSVERTGKRMDAKERVPTGEDYNTLFAKVEQLKRSLLRAKSEGFFSVAIGNPFDGLRMWGPFDSHDAAEKWAGEDIQDDWWIVELDSPEED